MRCLAFLLLVNMMFWGWAQEATVQVDVSAGRLRYSVDTSQLASAACAPEGAIQTVDAFASLLRGLLLYMPLELAALESAQQAQISELELVATNNQRTLLQLYVPVSVLDSEPTNLQKIQRGLYASNGGGLECDSPAALWLDNGVRNALVNLPSQALRIVVDDAQREGLESLLSSYPQLNWQNSTTPTDTVTTSDNPDGTDAIDAMDVQSSVLPSQVRSRPLRAAIPQHNFHLPPATLPSTTLPLDALPPTTLPSARLDVGVLAEALPDPRPEPEYNPRPEQALNGDVAPSPATSVALPSTLPNQPTNQPTNQVTSQVASQSSDPASYGAAVAAQPPVLLPSVRQRLEQQADNPLVLPAIPDVSSPSVAYPLYTPEPVAPVAPAAPATPNAFRFGLGSAPVIASHIRPEVLANAGETSEGYLHLVGYERLPAISDLRVTNFAAAQNVIDRQRHYVAIIETNKGRIIAELYSQLAPITVNNFVFLSRYHFYDGVPFHRVVANFLAQTGDPTGTGTGTAGYTFADEIHSQLIHGAAGVLSMANNGADTNGSQFFMSLQAMPWLDGKHSIFGQVIAGYEVLGRLQPTDPSEKLPVFYLNLATTLDEAKARGIELDDEAEFRARFSEALTLVENTTFTTEALPATREQPAPTLGDYLNLQQGALPSEGVRFVLGGREMVLVVDAEGKKQLAVFAPDDFIERVYILQEIRQ